MSDARTELPGDRPWAETVAAMIRVDHAGEYAAARIYDGQLAVLGDHHPATPIIRHMREQEVHHLAHFDGLINQRRIRPTLLSPLWHVASFALGAGTALLGEKAAMACTAAVEEVIDEHYAGQLAALATHEPELAATVAEFRADEIVHRDTAIAHGAKDAPGLLSGLIKAGCRTAIFLSQRI